MDYVPWSESGCSLAEARDRTAERAAWNRWRELADQVNSDERERLEKSLGVNCLQDVKNGRLIAYGRYGHEAASFQLINGDDWGGLREIHWSKSTAVKGRADGVTIFDIRVFPPLLAPCRWNLLDGRPLAEIFQTFILKDIEVEVLASDAVRAAPEWKQLFVEGRRNLYGVEEWSLSHRSDLNIDLVHPVPEKRFRYAVARKPDPIEVVLAAEAVGHRYEILMSPLRTGQMLGEGFNVALGSREQILPTIWSRKEFWLSPMKGDLLEDNRESKDRDDRYLRRYIGIVLRRGLGDVALRGTMPMVATPPRSLRDDEQQLSHVKPTVDVPVPSSSIESQAAGDSVTRKTPKKDSALRECRAWLVSIMRQSPNERTESKSRLRAKAQEKWPKLAVRKFDRAWDEALEEAGATGWSKAGAPKRKRP